MSCHVLSCDNFFTNAYILPPEISIAHCFGKSYMLPSSLCPGTRRSAVRPLGSWFYFAEPSWRFLAVLDAWLADCCKASVKASTTTIIIAIHPHHQAYLQHAQLRCLRQACQPRLAQRLARRGRCSSQHLSHLLPHHKQCQSL